MPRTYPPRMTHYGVRLSAEQIAALDQLAYNWTQANRQRNIDRQVTRSDVIRRAVDALIADQSTDRENP